MRTLCTTLAYTGCRIGERFFRAGGVPAVMWELREAGLLHEAMAVTGRPMRENLDDRESHDREMIRSRDAPLAKAAGFVLMTGNPFDTAIMKTSVSAEVPRRPQGAAAAQPLRGSARVPERVVKSTEVGTRE